MKIPSQKLLIAYLELLVSLAGFACFSVFQPFFPLFPTCLAYKGTTVSFLEMFDDGTKPQLTRCSENYEWITRKRLRWGTDRDYGTFNLSIACPDSPSEMIRSCSAKWFAVTMRLIRCSVCNYRSGSSCGKIPRKRMRLVEVSLEEVETSSRGLRSHPRGCEPPEEPVTNKLKASLSLEDLETGP